MAAVASCRTQGDRCGMPLVPGSPKGSGETLPAFRGWGRLSPLRWCSRAPTNPPPGVGTARSRWRAREPLPTSRWVGTPPPGVLGVTPPPGGARDPLPTFRCVGGTHSLRGGARVPFPRRSLPYPEGVLRSPSAPPEGQGVPPSPRGCWGATPPSRRVGDAPCYVANAGQPLPSSKGVGDTPCSLVGAGETLPTFRCVEVAHRPPWLCSGAPPRLPWCGSAPSPRGCGGEHLPTFMEAGHPCPQGVLGSSSSTPRGRRAGAPSPGVAGEPFPSSRE